MAFTPTVTNRFKVGDRELVYGTYVNAAGSTGGDIVTGLRVVENLFMQPLGAAILANQPVVNETFPLLNTGGAVTVVNTANESGSWWAIGNV